MEAETENKSAIKGGSIEKSKASFIVVKEIHKTEVVEGNNETQDEAKFIHGLHILSVVGLCILLSSPVILIPQHDAVQFPEFWYELLVTFSLTYPVQWTLLGILDNHFLLNIKRLASPKTGIVLALSPLLGFVLIYCGLYLFWTYKLGFIYLVHTMGIFYKLVLQRLANNAKKDAFSGTTDHGVSLAPDALA